MDKGLPDRVGWQKKYGIVGMSSRCVVEIISWCLTLLHQSLRTVSGRFSEGAIKFSRWPGFGLSAMMERSGIALWQKIVSEMDKQSV